MNSQDAHNRITNMIAPKTTPTQHNNARKIAKESAISALEMAIASVRKRKHDNPKDWERGYNSAITGIELLMQKIETGKITL